MGISTDATLAYGLDLGGGDNDFTFEFLDEDGRPFASEYEIPGWYDEDDGLNEAIEQRLEELGAGEDITVEVYCSTEYTSYILAAKDFTVRRGTALEVDTTVPEDADAKLAAAVEALQIRFKEPQRPRWLLVSYWG